MGRPRKNRDPTEESYRPLDPESREQQMIGLAVNLTEQKLRDGTASSQIITHYLKLASTRAAMELQLMEQDLELKKAKTAAIEADQRAEQRYINAVNAMRLYNGGEP